MCQYCDFGMRGFKPTIPDLPAGWMQEEQEWMLHKNPKKEKKA